MSPAGYAHRLQLACHEAVVVVVTALCCAVLLLTLELPPTLKHAQDMLKMYSFCCTQ